MTIEQMPIIEEVVAIVALVSFTSTDANVMSSTELLNLSGFIQAVVSAENDAPVSIALVLADGTELPILHKGAGVDLVDHIGADVELVGCWEATPALESGKALRVRSYDVTDGYEDPWYDDDDE